MNALKALRKLKNNKKHAVSDSMMRLKLLTRADQENEKGNLYDKPLRGDLKKLSNEVVISMVSELSAPLNPVISWFEINHRAMNFSSFQLPSSNKIKTISVKKVSQKNSLLMRPLKSPPCKRCPALVGSPCKCACKKFS